MSWPLNVYTWTLNPLESVSAKVRGMVWIWEFVEREGWLIITRRSLLEKKTEKLHGNDSTLLDSTATMAYGNGGCNDGARRWRWRTPASLWPAILLSDAVGFRNGIQQTGIVYGEGYPQHRRWPTKETGWSSDGFDAAWVAMVCVRREGLVTQNQIAMVCWFLV